jgi:ribonuclease PH
VPFSRDELSALMGLAEKGNGELTALQRQGDST